MHRSRWQIVEWLIEFTPDLLLRIESVDSERFIDRCAIVRRDHIQQTFGRKRLRFSQRHTIVYQERRIEIFPRNHINLVHSELNRFPLTLKSGLVFHNCACRKLSDGTVWSKSDTFFRTLWQIVTDRKSLFEKLLQLFDRIFGHRI